MRESQRAPRGPTERVRDVDRSGHDHGLGDIVLKNGGHGIVIDVLLAGAGSGLIALFAQFGLAASAAVALVGAVRPAEVLPRVLRSGSDHDPLNSAVASPDREMT